MKKSPITAFICTRDRVFCVFHCVKDQGVPDNHIFRGQILSESFFHPGIGSGAADPKSGRRKLAACSLPDKITIGGARLSSRDSIESGFDGVSPHRNLLKRGQTQMIVNKKYCQEKTAQAANITR
jgi:hypothetical protein